MLRNRSRAVTSKQAPMADQPSFLCPSNISYSPIASFLGSPRFSSGYLSKQVSDSETAVSSPVSTLFLNPFGYCDRNQSKSSTPSPENPSHSKKQEAQAIGLALIDSIAEDEFKFNRTFSKPVSRIALLGTKLKVQIPEINPLPPPTQPVSPVESPKSPAEFGIKTRSPQLASPLSRSRDLIRQLSLKEMELCEDYTCVITHGPNPKTTHIFDECIVESCCGDDHSSLCDEMKLDYTTEASTLSGSPMADFLGFCYHCKDILKQDEDIYIYRGEKAFCSDECRFQEMMHMEGMKNPEVDSHF